jgi:hypothetical protein
MTNSFPYVATSGKGSENHASVRKEKDTEENQPSTAQSTVSGAKGNTLFINS